MTSERHTHILNLPAGTRVTLEDENRRKSPGWFRLYRPIVRNGIWAKLSAAARAVYPVLAECCNQDWVASIAYEQPVELRGTSERLGLCELSGQSRSAVNRAMRDLRDAGLVIVRRDGRGRKHGVYQLVPVLDAEHGKHATRDTFNVSPETCSPAAGGTFNVPLVAHSQYMERARELSRLSLETTTSSAAVVVLMRGTKLTQEQAAELAALAENSVERATRGVEYWRGLVSSGKLRGSTFGAIKAAIVGNFPVSGEVTRSRIGPDRAEKLRRERQAELAEFSADLERDQAFKAQLSQMSRLDRDALVNAALAELPQASQRRIHDRDPVRNRVLRAVLWDYMQRTENADAAGSVTQ